MIRLGHMNDTNIKILAQFNANTQLSSSDVHSSLTNISLVTVKRRLSELTESGLLLQSGAGRSVKYSLTKQGLLLKPVDVDNYLAKDLDKRGSSTIFNFELFRKPYVSLFSQRELELLDRATETFRANAQHSDATLRSKELLRFIIEFSWKTSQIEGNTYDLLSTERLLRYGEKSKNNTEFEAQMIINQKEALELILDNIELWHEPKIALLEQLHLIVGKNLSITPGIRKGLVGITGTNYRPLDNEFQIKEALTDLFKWIQSAGNHYEKSLLCILGVSYIQPFIDGNKRTSRLLGNSILLNAGLAPLSYRTVDDRVYKEATLVFYEQNSVEPFKQLFIEQYIFAAENYNIYRP